MAEEEDIFSQMETNTPSNNSKINTLKQKIHDKEYLIEAIQRIAYILSNEIAGIPGERRGGERKG